MSDPAPHRHAGVTPADRRTVAKVVTATLVTICLVTAVTVAVLYRHYDRNLHVVDITPELGQRPAHGPARDRSEGPGQHPGDGLGQPRRARRPHRRPHRDRPEVRHHDPAPPLRRPPPGVRRERAARLGRGPAVVPRHRRQADLASGHRGAVERRLQHRWSRLHGPSVRAAHRRSASTTTSSSTSRPSRGWSTRSVASRSASRSRSSTPSTASTSPPARGPSPARTALNYVRARYTIGDGRTSAARSASRRSSRRCSARCSPRTPWPTRSR